MHIYGVGSAAVRNVGNQVSASGGNADFAGVLRASGSASETDLESIFEAASKKYNIPLSLLKAVARVESNFHANATSRCGAMGIMQLMPRTAKSLGVTDAYDPEQNIMGGAKYLRQMLNEFGGSVEVALAAYNAGPGNVRKHGGVPSFAQGYVNKVLGYCGDDIQVPASSTSSVTPSDTKSAPPAAPGDGGAGSLSPLLLMNACWMWMLQSADDKLNFLPNTSE